MVHLRILLLASSACLTWQTPSGFLRGAESDSGSGIIKWANGTTSTPIGNGKLHLFQSFWLHNFDVNQSQKFGYNTPQDSQRIGLSSNTTGTWDLEVDMEMVGGFQSIPLSGPCIGMMIHGKNLRCCRVAVWDEN